MLDRASELFGFLKGTLCDSLSVSNFVGVRRREQLNQPFVFGDLRPVPSALRRVTKEKQLVYRGELPGSRHHIPHEWT